MPAVDARSKRPAAKVSEAVRDRLDETRAEELRALAAEADLGVTIDLTKATRAERRKDLFR